ncbi:MAG: PEP-CTERM sorting domain-containing protein [Phycisphaerae bacterium]|nr:PEP-CTERM sorting domain-containing protein [Phycisphaerae bacterium]
MSARLSAALSLLSLCVFASASAAQVNPIVFAVEDDVLFRINGANVGRYFLSDKLTALDFDDHGVLWGVGVDDDNNNLYELYRIDDPFGTPTLNLVSENIDRRTESIIWVGSTLYGIQGSNVDAPQTLVTLDPNTGAATPVGVTGNTGINPEQVGGIAIKDGIMYALNNRLPGELYSIDWTLSSGTDPTATFLTATSPATLFVVTDGLDNDPNGGPLWAMIRRGNIIGSDIGVYRLDETTGQLTLVYDLSDLTDVRGASGLAVIPEPATLLLLLAGAAPLVLRRRSKRP